MEQKDPILGYDDKIWGKFLKDFLTKAVQEVSHANILIAGNTGAGKTTLVNQIFGEELGKTGKGLPVTTKIQEIKKENFPITIFDTRGFESLDFARIEAELVNLINTRREDADFRNHIHIAWICILDKSDRVEPAHISLAEKLHELSIPTIAIITKCSNKKGVNEFTKIVEALLPTVRCIIPTRALEEIIEDEENGSEIIKKPFGLDELVRSTMDLVPEAQQNAIIAAQKVDLFLKRKRAEKAILKYTVPAIASGFIFAPVGVPINVVAQMAMMTEISVIWGLPTTKSFIIALCWGSASSGFALSNIAAIILHFLPIIGSVPVALFNSTIIAIIGKAYIEALTIVTQEDINKKIEEREIIDEFRKQMVIHHPNIRRALE